MDKAEALWIASIALERGYDYEELKWSDYLYGREHLVDGIWEYVEECLQIGKAAWKERYKDYRLHI